MCKKCDQIDNPMDERGIESLDKLEQIIDDVSRAAYAGADADSANNPNGTSASNRYLSYMSSLAARIEAKMIINLYGKGEEICPEMTSTEMLARCCEIVEDNTHERLQSLVGMMYLAKNFDLPTASKMREHYKNHLPVV